jgi:hypothetical protein
MKGRFSSSTSLESGAFGRAERYDVLGEGLTFSRNSLRGVSGKPVHHWFPVAVGTVKC